MIDTVEVAFQQIHEQAYFLRPGNAGEYSLLTIQGIYCSHE